MDDERRNNYTDITIKTVPNVLSEKFNQQCEYEGTSVRDKLLEFISACVSGGKITDR